MGPCAHGSRGLEELPGTHEPIITPAVHREALEASTARLRGQMRRPAAYRQYLLSGVVYCACGTRMRGETRVSRGMQWAYYFCPERCGRLSIRADHAEQTVLDRIAAGVLPDKAIAAARNQLRQRLQTRDTDADERMRARLEGALRNLSKQHAWSVLSDDEYLRQRREVQDELDQMTPPEKVIVFDRLRRILTTVAENLAHASPEQRHALVRLVVERVDARDTGTFTIRKRRPRQEVDAASITWAGPARPFFAHAGVGLAPPEGFEPPTPALGRRRSIH